MKARRPSRRREPIISLINIVFLILIFFMVAGTLSGPPPNGVAFVQTSDLSCCSEPGDLTVTAAGETYNNAGDEVSIESFTAGLDAESAIIRLVPDRDLPAWQLLDIIERAQNAGAVRVIVLTEDTGS